MCSGNDKPLKTSAFSVVYLGCGGTQWPRPTLPCDADLIERGDGRLYRQDRLRHLARGWAITVHAFQGRTVDNIITAMEAKHPYLTTQKSFYVEISRARNKVELVTDSREGLREHLETATGERVAALEVVEGRENALQRSGRQTERETDRAAPEVSRHKAMPEPEKTKVREGSELGP